MAPKRKAVKHEEDTGPEAPFQPPPVGAFVWVQGFLTLGVGHSWDKATVTSANHDKKTDDVTLAVSNPGG
jgi:hypothetical protein